MDIKTIITPALVWFVTGFVIMFFELASPGFIIFFFGIGAWITAIVCLASDVSINLQLSIFITTSIALLVSLRKWVKRTFTGKLSAHPDMETMDEYAGAKATVIRAIPLNGRGKVDFQGTEWDAEADEHIDEHTPVIIVQRNSIVLKVRKV